MDTTDNPPAPGPRTANDYVATRLRAEMAMQKLNAKKLAGLMCGDGTAPEGLDPIYPSVDYVRRRARGEVVMSIEDVQRFAYALEVSVGQLLTDLTGP